MYASTPTLTNLPAIQTMTKQQTSPGTQSPDKKLVLNALSALASEPRLDAFRLLVSANPGGMVSGEIAAALEMPLTNTSFHLKTLVQAGLASVEQEGRYQRYRANMDLMILVMTFLTRNCCAQDPQAKDQMIDHLMANLSVCATESLACCSK